MSRARKVRAVRNRARGTWVCFPVIDGKRTTRKLANLNEMTQEQADAKAKALFRDLKLVAGREVPTVAVIVDRYRSEKLPTLRHSSQLAAESFLKCHVLPRWGATPILDLRPRDVQLWLESLPLAGKTRGHLRSLLHGLYDFAMWSSLVAVQQNPISLVRVRGASKRVKAPQPITPEQFRAMAKRLDDPYRLMATVQACLGLRVSELLGLRWQDVDWLGATLTIENALVGRQLGPTKTESSRKVLSLDPALISKLGAWRERSEFRGDADWVFASPYQLGRWPVSYTQYRDTVRDAAVAVGLGRISTHVFRHSFRSWLDAAGTAITVQRELMRHSDIRMTLNTYGGVITGEQREAAAKIAALVVEPDFTVISKAVTH